MPGDKGRVVLEARLRRDGGRAIRQAV